jgi:hypothetical protein
MNNHAWVTDVLDDLKTYLELNDQPAVMAAVAFAGELAEMELGRTQDDTSEPVSPAPVAPSGQRLCLVRSA